ncbi:Ankyrin repeat and SOCS box protein 3 [Entomophthora muscae]|uniref:Ankyrin repeat and SOCS box protein 3 n=1 Tax=Entomophthora muscae TaxID=34485 RepID=A0ACC2UJX2_9FUNG|nr:Ankyrin repeat and SOCS box protein 3 [Entomophthora muscae]
MHTGAKAKQNQEQKQKNLRQAKRTSLPFGAGNNTQAYMAKYIILGEDQGHGEMHILLANLQDHNIHVKKYQIVGFAHLLPIEELTGLQYIRDLSKMGLPDQIEASAYVTTPLADLSSLDKEQQEQASSLFKKYRFIFAEDDFDLECATDVTYHIDTGENKPI